MNVPSFSVLINNYNYGRFIAEAVDSVLRQELLPLEIVVVDDGSTDGSAEQVQARYAGEPLVRVLAKDNGGQLSAFQAGVEQARGEVVCFLDSDDRWEPGHLRALAAAYAADPGLDFVSTNLRYFGEREGLYDPRTEDYDYGLTALPTVFLRRWIGGPTSALSLRRELARRVLDLPAAAVQEWRCFADDCLVYGASVLGAHKKYLAAATVRYRMHGNNVTCRARAPVPQMKHEYRVQRLLDFYARREGFDETSLRLVKQEFKTKPRPSAAELKLYLELLRRAPLGFWHRLELGLSMRRYQRGRG
jgi:glycosyltransferase involved in cell wall biosynthesis